MKFPRSYWEKMASVKTGVGAVGKSADTVQPRYSSRITREKPDCRSVGAYVNHSPENAKTADTDIDNRFSPGISEKKLENRCRQLLPTSPTLRAYKVVFPASLLEKTEFWATDDVGKCRQLEIDCCATCKHWRPNLPTYNKVTRKYVKDEYLCPQCHVKHEWHHCTQLFYVQKHVYGSEYEKGDVLTRPEQRDAQLQNIDYLSTTHFFYCHMYEAKEAIDDAA